MAKISLIVNGNPVNANIDPVPCWCNFYARIAADRHPCRLRHVAMRRLCRASGRQGRQILHDAGGDGDGHEVRTIEGLAAMALRCIRCRRRSVSITACNAASARPA